MFVLARQSVRVRVLLWRDHGSSETAVLRHPLESERRTKQRDDRGDGRVLRAKRRGHHGERLLEGPCDDEIGRQR